MINTHLGGCDNSFHDVHELFGENLGMYISGTVLHDGVQDKKSIVHYLAIVVKETTSELFHHIFHSVKE